MRISRENTKRIMFLIAFTMILLAGLLNIDRIGSVLGMIFHIIFPFIVGGAIAFIINMPMKWMENTFFGREKWKNNETVKKLKRPVSLVLALIFILAIICVVFFVVVPQLGETVIRLGNDVRIFWPKAQEWAIDLFENNPEIAQWIGSLEMDWDKVVSQAISFVKVGAGTILGSTVSVAKTIVSGVANTAIAFVFAIYLLISKETLKRQLEKVLKAFCNDKKVESIVKICSLTHHTFANFLAGQCIEAVILGGMFFIAMSLFRFPYAMLVGVLIAFTALIPIFGAFIGCAIGTFLILVENPMQALAFVVLFLVLQQIEGNLIYPHVVGNSVGLPSIWVLVAVTIGGSLMGIVGMLIFIPFISVVYTLFRGYIDKRLKDKILVTESEEHKE